MRRAVAGARAQASRALDRGLGVETRGLAWQRDTGYAYGLYRPTSWLVLHRLFGRLEVSEDDVFLDVGSGMGRVLLMAARRPFKRVIGVEQNEKMTTTARRNVERHRRRLTCPAVELVTADVLEWGIPDDLSVVYLYCPFPDHALERFIHRLLASLDRRPRPLRMIYNFGTVPNRETVMHTGRARMVELRAPWYLRSAFEEIWMARLLPGEWAGRRLLQ
jgi:SAM-dependent methyltransferase